MSVITAKQLTKVFARKVRAVDGVDLDIAAGEIFGFLGPNGAGKTTTLRMLATLLPIDSGEATIAGYNVQKQPHEVRKRLGYVGQAGGADHLASGREDLLLQGKLYGMNAAKAAARAAELVAALDLTDFIDRRISTYSGGQKRRLHVALGIMHRPDVLFLDEPTSGLDPQNRANLWAQIRKLKATGTTIFLTTHYLEEADVLADRIAIMDYGKIVAEGTSKELKQQISGDSIVISFKTDGANLERATNLLKQQDYVREANIESEQVRLYVKDGAATLPAIIRLLDGENLAVKTIALSEPTLDDVFLRKTGRSLRDTEATKSNGERK
jgi:ABC-2 type transport system ATP-binding protein